MELLRFYKEHGYFDVQLYHCLQHKRLMPEDTMIIPSEYIKTMKMSTMERLQHLNGMEISNVVSPDPTKPVKPKLEFSPRIIVFQNFQPNERIVTKLTVQNIHHFGLADCQSLCLLLVSEMHLEHESGLGPERCCTGPDTSTVLSPTFVNMKFKPTTHFSLKPVGSALLSRLAPGISVTYAITFTPITIEDIVHEITFQTDTDKYVVGLIAMSHRLVFDFPDEITIPPTPLKVEKSTTIIIENISKTTGSFTVVADCPFSAYPRMISSTPGSQKELKVSIKTMYLGDIEGILLIKFETGETFKIKVKGTVYSVGIELEKPVVRFLDTYNTMARQQTFKITNKSNDELTFMCMKNPSIYEDFDDKIKLARTFYEMKDSESAKHRKLVQYDVLSSDEHNRVYTRIFFDEIHSLVADETLQFQSPYFSIMPIQGFLWPNKTTEITISFEPKELGDFKAVAYLDIDGTQDRVPLTLHGTSLPPNIFLNVESLDMDNAYINKVYSYEIIAINRGHITGVIHYRPVEPLFGSIITCTPEMHCLQPGEKDVFVVSFLNSNQGAFFEELEFSIRDTNVVRKLYLKGTIIYPTLIFGVPCLDFNEVCVGVSKTLQVEVINESEVKVNASVKIASDGPEISAITLEDCEAAETSKLEIAKWPKEFNITPSHIEFGAFSKVTLRVTLTANLARTNHTFLELELDKSDSPPITLPISFDAKVPDITPAPNIKLRACFVDFIYTYDLILSCDRYWGFFTILPPDDTEEGALDVQLGITRGTIRPNTTLRLPCNIRATCIGKREHVVRMSLFGLRQPIEICHISAMGVKPIVSCTPLGLSYGQIKLLHRINKTLTLNNDSPVAVNFKATILHKDQNWLVSPEDGVVEAESDVELTVSVCLIDVDTSTNKVIIQLEKVKDICVPVSAVGYGTSIVVGLNKSPIVDIGRHFCKLPMTCYVPIKNCGTRMHCLDWLETFKTVKSSADEVKFFHLNPLSFKMKGGEVLDLEISACAPKAVSVREQWHLVGSVEGVNKKELLMTCEIIGEFVDPKLIIFPTAINLRYDYGPFSEYYKLTEVLTIKNVSKLPLEIELNMKSPFAIVHKEGTYKCGSTEEEMCNCINYQETDLNIEKINEMIPRDNKFFIDCLTKKPVPVEKSSLEFFQNIHKIKMAFNLTHTVQETLEHEEYMKIQILFDTTKHTNLKSKVYTDILRIRLRGHKNKDAVKLVGVIHFPNVSVLTPKIDFRCVLNGSLESRVIKLYNPTALLVCYSFQWKKCSIIKIKVPELSKLKIDVEKISVKSPTEDAEVEKGLDVDEAAIGSLEEERNPSQLDDAKDNIEGSMDQGSVSVQSTMDTEEGLNLFKTKVLQKIAPMIRLQKNSPLTYWSHKLPQYKQPIKTYNINDIFMLVPHEGKLKPEETHEIHIMFKPCRDFSIRALLKCKVLGGPSEIIAVSGQSSDLMFKLNTQTLNFKIRSFHENASENLVVHNIALYPIEFTTYLDEPVFENELPATILDLTPAESTIDPEEVAEITVHMRVGILGYFSRTFILELGHLPHIPIEVFGWGVIPQVYLSLSRPGMNKFNPELGYHAIATLTLDYLDAVKDIFNKCSDLHLNSADPERCFEDPDFQEDWHICSAWDGYPSVMDIELAVERVQVVKHINARPEILKFFASTGRGSVIPGYQTAPYTLDFGVMITDTSVTCFVDMVNYGPTPVRVHLSKQSHIRYWLDMKLCTKLEPGETGKIEITFAPNSHEFKECEQSLDITYYLEVPYGVVIPLNVKSEIAVPFLHCNVDKVDFGSVRCGDKVIISIPLKNTGKPTCIWYVTLKAKTPGPPAMTVMENSGKYEPGEGGWLSITFRPTMEITYEAVLIFRFHMNHSKMVIPVKGNGLFPHVHIIGPNMNFPPTLPWSDQTELYFGITNPCPFPVELIIAHVDEDWKEEEERLQLLYRYYNKPEEMLVPAFKPGDDTPAPIRDFFATFKKNITKEIEAEAAAVKASAKGAKGKSTPKSPKKDKAGDKSKAEKDGPPAYKKRSEAEIVSDVIKGLKAQQVDPLKECIMKMDHNPTHETVMRSGLIVFLYGSPAEETQSLELAYTLGMTLALPTINFDSTIIQALVHSECLAKSILMSTLNDNYDNLKKPYEDMEAELPPDLRFSEYQDDFEIIKSKIELFITSSLRTAGTPRSKMSDKRKTTAGVTGTATSAPLQGAGVFNQDLIEELLKDYFSHEKFDRGFVMDSLTSYLLKSPSGVLTTTMRCKPSVTNIHLALCLSEFSMWAHRYEEALHEEELAEEEAARELNITPDFIAQIINKFNEMDGDEYENADPTLKAIYIQYGLESRRQKHIEKCRLTGMLRLGERPKEKLAKDVGTSAPETPMDKKKSGRKEDGRCKTTPEFYAMQTRYNDYYKNIHEGLIQIACNWIVEQGDMGYPLVALNGLPLGATPKKGKKPPKSEITLGSVADIEHVVEKGFPLTLLMCPCLSYREAFTKLFTEVEYYIRMLEKEEPFNILECPPKKQEFTVLLQKTMPVIHPTVALQWLFLEESPIRKCECNQITDLNLLDDTTQDNVLNILAKWHCVCGKKSSLTSTSYISSSEYAKTMIELTEEDGEEAYLCPLPVRVVESTLVPNKGRVILLPGDLMRCKFMFKPTVEGHYSLKRFVEVTGWPESRIDINSTGICDLPRLDSRPKKMFADFVRKTEDDQVYKHTFLDDLKKFVFGPIFIGALRIYEEEYTIVLRNASLLPCHITIEFINSNIDIYHIDKYALTLEPGERDTLTLSAAPAQGGEYENAILLIVKDNPEVVRINISCKGVVPVVEILPQTKTIDYGRVLLYRREDDRFIIKNDSELPIMWTARNPEDFAEDFIMPTTKGIILQHENCVVPITYTACNVRVFTQLALFIDIYDALGRGDPMVVDAIYISGECYDVLVECSFDNPTDNFLNFGNVKVNSTVYREMYLVNRGLYNIYYKLKKVKNFPEPSVLKSMEVDHECGVIAPGARQVAVEFLVTPSTKVDLRNVPAYSCYLLDGRKEQVVVAKFPVSITIASFYNTFTLFPLGELNFHIISVGTGIVREVILNNTSKCPFNYKILVPEIYREPSISLSPEPQNKVKIPPIKCGNFLIMNDDNLLLPGQSKIIFIQFIANAPRRFQETIHFIVTDTCPAEADGVPLRLVGTGALPTIDFWNLENTFREHLIVKDMAEYSRVEVSTPHCVFLECSVMLYFFCVTVNTKHTAYIDLYNNGLVTAKVYFILHYQKNTNADIFSLEKDVIHIDSFQHWRLGIIFTPKALMEYRAVLEIKLHKALDAHESFSLCLVGEGVIPRIQILQPTVKKHKFGVFHFPVTCLGSMSHKILTFKNIGTVKSSVTLSVMQSPKERPVFWLSPEKESEELVVGPNEENQYLKMQMVLQPDRVATIECYFNPLFKGRVSCDISVKIKDNPYEYFTILCDAEAFAEDVILMGLKLLSLESDTENIERSSSLSADSKKPNQKPKSAGGDRRKSLLPRGKLPGMRMGPDGDPLFPAVLKYVLDFGGCELLQGQKRTVIMVNNSEKVYRFVWDDVENIAVKPSIGYISPGEEKDIEIMFFTAQPIVLQKEMLTCHLAAVSNDTLTLGNTWDNRQTKTTFETSKECVQERIEISVDEIPKPEENIAFIDFVILYSAVSEFTKYSCDLPQKLKILDTYIYQKRKINFEFTNVGNVPLRVLWTFSIEEDYPARLDKYRRDVMVGPELQNEGKNDGQSDGSSGDSVQNKKNEQALPPPALETTDKNSKATLFSASIGRESVDTWFEMELPFAIEPTKACLNQGESQTFNVTFSPQEAFEYKVCLKSLIDNLDPYDQDISCKIKAKALVPYVHLELEECDYVAKNKRLVMPKNSHVLMFKVIGAGCYKKSFNVVNPTSEAYDYMFECVPIPEVGIKTPELPMEPIHCDKVIGFVEGGMSDVVTFTFDPTCTGIYETQWRFFIAKYDLSIPFLVVGMVSEPNVVLVPTILKIPHCLVGFTHNSTACLKNNEDEELSFEYKAHTLMVDTGKNPIVVQPRKGILKPHSETPITIYYTPLTDGPLSFKVLFNIIHMIKPLTLVVNALSYWIKPEVTYYICSNEHILDYDVVTRIHLEQTASTYERMVKFKLRNRGSITFKYEWKYDISNVKKYLDVYVKPRTGWIPPDNSIDCVLHFNLKNVPVEAFPLTLSISNGPDYQIALYAEIEKPLYNFASKIYDFGKCFVGAPDATYKKNLSFINGDLTHILLTLDTESCSELFIGFTSRAVAPRQRVKIPIYFRPKKIRHYEFELFFRVNSLCEEKIHIRGEGIPLILDLYKGCQKSFNLGPVKVGDKIIKEIEVINHSQIPIEAEFFFTEATPVGEDEKKKDEISVASSICLNPSTHNIPTLESRVQTLTKQREIQRLQQLEIDNQHAMESVKVIPSKCVIQPHRKSTLKILFRPIGLISDLQIHLKARVLSTVIPLVVLNGSATGMNLCLSQNSLQFGRVLNRGCKILKVMLMNQGDFGTRFWWQPLVSSEFTITPMQGYVDAHNNVTFNIQFRPRVINPYVKVWANCNIENYKTLDLAMYGACLDVETPQSRALYMQCRVRESEVDTVTFTNPTEENWYVLSEITGDENTFETLREFTVPCDSSTEVPITFKPRTMGSFHANIYFAPLGESALSITMTGYALAPNPNDVLYFEVEAKKPLNVQLMCRNQTESHETYAVQTELLRVRPEYFDSHYEVRCSQFVKCWGQASAPCNWTYICFEPCEMVFQVNFIQQETLEYQYYEIGVLVTPSEILNVLKFCCQARESVEQEVSISNPLDCEADFTIQCDTLKIRQTITLFNKAEAKLLTMVFTPLVVGEFEDYLTITNDLIGQFKYRIEGICYPAKPKEMEVRTPLGTSRALRLRVANKTDILANFVASVSHPSIIAEKEYGLPRTQRGKFLVYFEPTELGAQHIKVSFNCPVAGEYVFEITGYGTEPKPQGPVDIPPGPVGAGFKFKNVFTEEHTFRIYLDNEDFFIKKNLEVIKSKDTTVIQVYLTDVGAQSREPPTGCLTIENFEPAEPRVQWNYFLQAKYK